MFECERFLPIREAPSCLCTYIIGKTILLNYSFTEFLYIAANKKEAEKLSLLHTELEQKEKKITELTDCLKGMKAHNIVKGYSVVFIVIKSNNTSSIQ